MSKTSWYVFGLALAGAAGILIFFGPYGMRVDRAPDDGRLRVVATFFPLYDFAREVGGDRIVLTLLFTATPEVASFAPADVQKIHDADVVIKNGMGLEPVLDELIAASDNKGVTVADTSTGVPPLQPADDEHAEEEEQGHAHEGADPHIWLNPRNAIVQVGNIRDALAAADPANAAFYRNNADAYVRQLERLDRDIAAEAAGFGRREFVAFHPAFLHFAERYGLRQAAVIEEFPGKEPSPAYLADVIRTIRDTGVRVIFAEPQFSPRIVEVIAQDLGLRVSALDPVETGDPARDSYISVMRRNLDILKQALR